MKFFLSIFAVFLVISLHSSAQLSLGIKAGPNYAWYIQSRSDNINKTAGGWGVDAGLALNAGDDHTLSFRSELLYSLLTDSTKLRFYDHSSQHSPPSLYGKFFRHNLLLSAQLQVNILKSKKLSLCMGPYFQYTIASTGRGVHNFYLTNTNFKGNEEFDSGKMFSNYDIGATLAIGIQKIRAGKISFFAEIRQNIGFLEIFEADYSQAEWIGSTTSVTIGVELYRSR